MGHAAAETALDDAAEASTYAERLEEALESPTKGAAGPSSAVRRGGDTEASDDDDEDEDEGAFVYTGKDAPPPLPYEERLREVVGADETLARPHEGRGDTEEHHLDERRDTIGAVQSLVGQGDATPVSPATSRITSGGSNDEFPTLNFRQGPQRARSSLGTTPTQRPPFHPSFSRLRSISTQSFPHTAGPGSSSKNRFVSSSTYNTAMEFPASATTSPRRPPFATGFGGTPSTSALDLDGFSRRSSVANLRDLPSASDIPLGEGVPTSNASSAGAGGGAGGGSSLAATAPPARTIKWSSLKRLSARLYPSSAAGNGGAAEQMARGAMGSPTVMAVSGLVAVGTSKGWVLVFDFGQNLRCVCGTEAIAKEAGAVTAVAVSQDHTFVAVGHETGHIHLYALIKPSQPARSVPPVALQQVLAGRKEGHLDGSSICHLGFVGARHTAIVSSDDKGLAFYHSLGKVLMLASTDIIRMLGRYPDPATALASPPPSTPSSRPPLATALTAPPPLASVASPPSSPAFPTSPRSNPLSTGFPHPPHPASRAATPSGGKKPSIVLDMAPLPLGPAPHPQTDPLSLVALLTPTKLVVVGLKPAPRTWWRVQFAREAALGGTGAGVPEEDVERGWASQGVVAWWPSARKASDDAAASGAAQDGKKDAAAGEEAQGEDPILAWSWGRRVRLVRVRGAKGGLAPLPKRNPVGALKPLPPPPASVDFEEIEGWNCDTAVLALRWYNERVIVVLTASHFDVYDVSTRQCIGRDAHDIRSIVSSDVYTSALPPALSDYDSLAYSASFAVFKRKLFLLGTSDLRAGAVLTWADRILALMQPATILDAIETTTAYLQGKVDASTIPLPEDPDERRDVLEPKLREILNASLDFVFSEERLRDGSHSDGDTIQRLFEGLVGTCVRACLVLGDADWLFDELYERYEQNGIEGIFLDRIEPFVLGGAMHTLPPSVSQRLIAIHAERRQFDAVQRIVWRVDPQNLDLNQVLGLCQREKLYDALIHVQTRALHDYVAPLVELFGLIRRIQQHRKRRPKRIGEGNGVDGVHDDGSDVEDALEADGGLWRSVTQLDQDVEATVPDAYKVFAYLSQELVGQSYPTGTALEYGEAVKARDELYGFLLSGSTRTWPAKGGRSVLTSDEDGAAEPTYPYIRLLLRFDTEATLDTLDLAFEDSYLDGEDDEVASSRRVSRQRVLDLLLEIMSLSSSFGSPDDADDFSPVDRTFLYIFVARNLPKYPQYLSLPVATLRDILVSLASDPDQSTVDDRQLAAEYLLSTYTPTDSDTLIPLFERAGFFRILRSIYRGERRWAALAATYLRDPDVASDVFGFLRETLKLAAKASATQKADLASTILDAVPTLVQVDETGLQQTADLVDTFLPSHHAEVVDRLATSHWRAFAYLRCLLEPSYAGMADTTAVSSADRLPSKHVDDALRRRYLSLLCAHEPQHVVRYLESEPSRVSQDAEVLRICEEAESFDALVWALDKNGEPEAALQRADETLEARTELLVERLVASGGEVEEDGAGSDEGVLHGRSVEALLEQVTAVSAAATAVCVRRTTGRRRPKDPPPEDLWFRLLSSLVATVRSVRSVAPGPDKPRDKSASQRRISTASIIVHDEEDAAGPLTPHAAELLSSLIPDALSSLVSTTSSHDVSFPRLVRRLIDSNASTPAANRSYAEFKAIVSSMLDTYSFEGDLLGLSSTITSQDLFEHVQEYQRERDRGWRPGPTNPSGTCAECLEPVWGPQGAGTSPAMSRSASVSLVLESMGPGDGARPRMKKRPSIKGKEVDWPDPPTHSPSGYGSPSLPQLDPPRGVVVGRDGRLWHQTCHLTRTLDEGM
ncbi:hypothetical protein Rhopal_004079-T1 [Rhodotorula paludigena]|uniref:Vacuolar protein sorting-associated protein 8 central domain-containing protein n=1 Tax=Rhodotorula paludigena TaxID=86838 RepID=A0AAV5GMB3_9BASI|nr:hypothetical protein Rhopal_004079-T1 [Rhodotorula paludigena]